MSTRPGRRSRRPLLAILSALLAVTVGIMHVHATPADAATPSTAVRADLTDPVV